MNSLTTFVRCWKIILRDATSICLTEHCSPLCIEQELYAPNAAIRSSNKIVRNSNLQNNLLTVVALLDQNLVYDDASVLCYMVDYASNENLLVKRGVVRAVQYKDGLMELGVRRYDMKRAVGSYYQEPPRV